MLFTLLISMIIATGTSEESSYDVSTVDFSHIEQRISNRFSCEFKDVENSHELRCFVPNLEENRDLKIFIINKVVIVAKKIPDAPDFSKKNAVIVHLASQIGEIDLKKNVEKRKKYYKFVLKIIDKLFNYADPDKKGIKKPESSDIDELNKFLISLIDEKPQEEESKKLKDMFFGEQKDFWNSVDNGDFSSIKNSLDSDCVPKKYSKLKMSPVLYKVFYILKCTSVKELVLLSTNSFLDVANHSYCFYQTFGGYEIIDPENFKEFMKIGFYINFYIDFYPTTQDIPDKDNYYSSPQFKLLSSGKIIRVDADEENFRTNVLRTILIIATIVSVFISSFFIAQWYKRKNQTISTTK